MKRPSFQFYPADWRNNAKLRRCSWEARGAWLEVICLLHDAEDYGMLRWTLKELSQAIGAPPKLLKELVDKGVLKGGDKQHEALIYTPRSGRKDGTPVTLVDEGDGALWMSSRMVIDEYKRNNSGGNTRFGAQNDAPSQRQGEAQGDAPSQRERDGATSSSSSTSTYREIDTNKSLSTPSREAEACLAIKAAGIPNVNPQHPDLIALIASGATPQDFANAASMALGKGNPFAYLLTVMKNQRDNQQATSIKASKQNTRKADHGKHDVEEPV